MTDSSASLQAFETNNPSETRLLLESRLTTVYEKGSSFETAKERLELLESHIETVPNGGRGFAEAAGGERKADKLTSLLLETGLSFALLEGKDAHNSPEFQRYLDIASKQENLDILKIFVAKSANHIKEGKLSTTDRATLGIPVLAVNALVRTVIDNKRYGTESNDTVIENIIEETLKIGYPLNHWKDTLTFGEKPTERMRKFLNQAKELALSNSMGMVVKNNYESLRIKGGDHSEAQESLGKYFSIYLEYFSNDKAELAQRISMLNKGRIFYDLISKPSAGTLTNFDGNRLVSHLPVPLDRFVIDNKFPQLATVIQASYVGAMHDLSLDTDDNKKIPKDVKQVLRQGMNEFFTEPVQVKLIDFNELNRTTSSVDTINVIADELASEIAFEPGFFKDSVPVKNLSGDQRFNELAQEVFQKLLNPNRTRDVTARDVYIFNEISSQFFEKVKNGQPVSFVLDRKINAIESSLAGMVSIVEKDVDDMIEKFGRSGNTRDLEFASANLMAASQLIARLSETRRLNEPNLRDRTINLMLKINRLELPSRADSVPAIQENYIFAKRNALKYLTDAIPNSETYNAGAIDPLKEAVEVFLKTVKDPNELKAAIRNIAIYEGAYSQISDEAMLLRLESALGTDPVASITAEPVLSSLKLNINRVQYCVLSSLKAITENTQGYDPGIVRAADDMIQEIGKSDFNTKFLSYYGDDRASNPHINSVRTLLRDFI